MNKSCNILNRIGSAMFNLFTSSGHASYPQLKTFRLAQIRIMFPNGYSSLYIDCHFSDLPLT